MTAWLGFLMLNHAVCESMADLVNRMTAFVCYIM